jgi:hypothetical protein
VVVTETINLCTSAGHGDNAAYVALYSPAGRVERIILLSSERPCEVGLRFEVDGAAWAVTCPLTGNAEGMWAAHQVKQ